MCLLRFNNVLIRVNNKLISILLTVNKCLLMAPYYKVLPNMFFQYWKSFGIDQGSWKVLEKIAMHCLWLLILLIPLK